MKLSMHYSYCFALIALSISSFSIGSERDESHHNHPQQDVHAGVNCRLVEVDPQQNEFGAKHGIIANNLTNHSMLILLSNRMSHDMLVEIFGEEFVQRSGE